MSRTFRALVYLTTHCVKCDKRFNGVFYNEKERKYSVYVIDLSEHFSGGNPNPFGICYDCVITVPSDLNYIEDEQFALYSPQKRQLLCSKDVDGEHIDLYVCSGGSYWLPMGG